jgi:hypothetical protein
MPIVPFCPCRDANLSPTCGTRTDRTCRQQAQRGRRRQREVEVMPMKPISKDTKQCQPRLGWDQAHNHTAPHRTTPCHITLHPHMPPTRILTKRCPSEPVVTSTESIMPLSLCRSAVDASCSGQWGWGGGGGSVVGECGLLQAAAAGAAAAGAGRSAASWCFVNAGGDAVRGGQYLFVVPLGHA